MWAPNLLPLNVARTGVPESATHPISLSEAIGLWLEQILIPDANIANAAASISLLDESPKMIPTLFRFARESFYVLVLCDSAATVFSGPQPGYRDGELGKSELSALPSRARGWTQICRRLYVCPDRGHPAATKIRRATNLFLPAVLRLPSYGTPAGGRSQLSGVADDSRSCELRSRPERGRLG